MTLDESAEHLEEIAAEMRAGNYSECSTMVLLTRDKGTSTMTLLKWGDEPETLISEAFDTV
jgi:hypothetical protein